MDLDCYIRFRRGVFLALLPVLVASGYVQLSAYALCSCVTSSCYDFTKIEDTGPCHYCSPFYAFCHISFRCKIVRKKIFYDRGRSWQVEAVFFNNTLLLGQTKQPLGFYIDYDDYIRPSCPIFLDFVHQTSLQKY